MYKLIYWLTTGTIPCQHKWSVISKGRWSRTSCWSDESHGPFHVLEFKECGITRSKNL